jgi:hypothetical protein
MLIGQLYNYFFKRRTYDCLNCGIFAWAGVSPDKFSPFMFNVLGVYNDNRGGDSCGVYFNKNIITGIRTAAKYESLVKSEKLHTTLKLTKNPVAIGHCRKASVGSVVEANIQPVIIRDKEKNDKLMYVHAHNGTITNYDDLAKKYKIETTKNESDSVVLAKLIQKHGFDILKEYDGSAALVMYFTKEPNVLYAFHGQSKSFGYQAEERPLHYITIEGYGTYISSEAAPLEFILNGEKATSFKHNVVYKLEGDTVEEFMKIERDNATFRKSKEPDYEIPFHSTNYPHYPAVKQTWYTGSDKKTLLTTGVTRNICMSTVTCRTEIKVQSNRIRYQNGLFYKGENLIHGECVCDAWGYGRTPSLYAPDSMTIYYLYFYYGHLVMNKDFFDDLCSELRANGISTENVFTDLANYNAVSSIIKRYSIFPFTRVRKEAGNGYMEPSAYISSARGYEARTFYTGSFTPLFTDYELHFSQGDLIGYRREESLYLISDLLADYPEIEEAFGKRIYLPKKGEKKVEPVAFKDCTECIENGYYDMGSKCVSCDVILDKKDHDEIAFVSEIIAESTTDIVNDLEKLINDVETSGVKDQVIDNFNSLVESKQILVKIIS